MDGPKVGVWGDVALCEISLDTCCYFFCVRNVRRPVCLKIRQNLFCDVAVVVVLAFRYTSTFTHMLAPTSSAKLTDGAVVPYFCHNPWHI